MNPDVFMLICFCWIDEMTPMMTQGLRLRRRGSTLTIGDSNVLITNMVGINLGLFQDKKLLPDIVPFLTAFLSCATLSSGNKSVS